jgi:hypothetical protein
MDYTFYDINTGIINFTVSSNSQPSPDNGSFIEGLYDSNLYIVTNGVAVRKSDNEIEQNEINSAWNELRKGRLNLLIDSDWTQVPDAPVNTSDWASYRQQLRDLPANTTDPRNVIWPSQPS